MRRDNAADGERQIRDLRDHGGDVVDRVSRGEAVTITRARKPVAELRPVGGTARGRQERDHATPRRQARPGRDSGERIHRGGDPRERPQAGLLPRALRRERGLLAHVDLGGPPRVGRYGVDLATFERLAIPALEQAGEYAVAIIHELGKMELASDAFRKALAALLDRPVPVALAAALAVRGPRVGHVYVDLATIRETAIVDADEVIELGTLAWPPVAEWTQRLAASGLVARGDEDVGPSRPLRLVGTSLYLDRYWREERQVAADLQALGDSAPED